MNEAPQNSTFAQRAAARTKQVTASDAHNKTVAPRDEVAQPEPEPKPATARAPQGARTSGAK